MHHVNMATIGEEGITRERIPKLYGCPIAGGDPILIGRPLGISNDKGVTSIDKERFPARILVYGDLPLITRRPRYFPSNDQATAYTHPGLVA
jgi:hypothetical protein